MSQQIQINYGAAPNDGQGDPLRTAFIKTDENFDNIWLAGPVGSNVTIANNTISVTNTNGNLILSPNGIGAIQTNSRLTPLANLTYDIGSQALRYRNVYASGIDVANAVLGNLSNINITVANLHVLGGSDGYVLQTDGTGNLTWVASTGVPGGANTQVQFNNAGSFGAQTGFTFNKTSNLLSVPGNITATGNITGNYFLGNGSQLTGLAATYGNANVVANLAALGTNPITTTGNITGNYFLGNGSQLTGIAATYSNSNVTTLLASLGSNIISGTGNITTTGNISGNYFIGNGSQLTGVTGNVTFSSEAVIGTGTSNTQSGLYLAPDSVSLANDLYLRVRGNIYDEPTHIHFDTGNNQYYNQFIGDDNKYIQLANTGNIVINTSDYIGNTAQWNFGTDGVLTLPNADASGFGNIYFEQNSSTITFGLDDNAVPFLYSFATSGITLPRGGATIRDTVGNALAFGRDAGATGPQGNAAVAIGQQAGETSQGLNAVAIGAFAGTNTQNANTVAIGREAGQTTQQAGAVAVGLNAGTYIQGQNAVAIGSRAGNTSQQTQSVAIGVDAAADSQGQNSVAIGPSAAAGSQGQKAVAIGLYAGNTTQGNSSVAIGDNAGFSNQGANAVAMGYQAGNSSQGASSVAIGHLAAANVQGFQSVAVGIQAGYNSQLDSAVAIGASAGATTQGDSAVAFGRQAGQTTQGTSAVAIGRQAGQTSQGNNSIILNATGSALNQTVANTFTVAPVRNDVANIGEVLFYNTTSKEITYGNTISIAGNITSAYLFGNGSQLTGITASVPSQTILPTIQAITVVARPAGLFGGGQGGANVTVANTIPVTEYGVIITDGTTSEKYKTGSLGSIPGTVSLTFTTGLNSTQFTVFAYVTSNAGTYYSGSATGTSGICLLTGTQIALSDGTRKAIEDITYTDKMLSWDFDRGCYAETTAVWIKRRETGSQYNLLTFSDGTTLRTFDQHRIFNKQAGAFTYPMTAATPIGTVTVNEHGQEITLTNKQVIVDTIEYYNVITDYHMNLFSDSILTSCRFNNIYPITDMKFVKDSRTLRTRAEFENVEDRFFYGLRLAEQTFELSMIEWYVNRLLSSEVATQPELAV